MINHLGPHHFPHSESSTSRLVVQELFQSLRYMGTPMEVAVARRLLVRCHFKYFQSILLLNRPSGARALAGAISGPTIFSIFHFPFFDFRIFNFPTCTKGLKLQGKTDRHKQPKVYHFKV